MPLNRPCIVRAGGERVLLPAFGLAGTEVDFVGNTFLIVGPGGQQQAIEIGSTLLTSQGDRVIMPGELFKLKDMQYYQEMASMF